MWPVACMLKKAQARTSFRTSLAPQQCRPYEKVANGVLWVHLVQEESYSGLTDLLGRLRALRERESRYLSPWCCKGSGTACSARCGTSGHEVAPRSCQRAAPGRAGHLTVGKRPRTQDNGAIPPTDLQGPRGARSFDRIAARSC